MRLTAHFSEQDLVRDQRRSTRRALRLDVPGEAPKEGGVAVTIHDVSLTGVLLQTAAKLQPGDSFQLELPEAGNVETMVVWDSGDFYGCQFRQPISPAQLSAALLKGDAKPTEVSRAAEEVNVVAELQAITAKVQRITARVERTLRHLAEDKNDPPVS